MRTFTRVSLALLAAALYAVPASSHAAVLAISHDKLKECGRGFVFCNGHQAYSLSEIESGAIQIPVFPLLPSEVVIVNDTGAPVTNLQLTLNTLAFFSFNMQCNIESTAHDYFNHCGITKSSSGFNNLFSNVSATFDFTAGNEEGIPDGAYFDITTVGFLPGGYLCGGGGTGGSGNGGGTGGGGTGGGGTGGNGGGPSY